MTNLLKLFLANPTGSFQQGAEAADRSRQRDRQTMLDEQRRKALEAQAQLAQAKEGRDIESHNFAMGAPGRAEDAAKLKNQNFIENKYNIPGAFTDPVKSSLPPAIPQHPVHPYLAIRKSQTKNSIVPMPSQEISQPTNETIRQRVLAGQQKQRQEALVDANKKASYAAYAGAGARVKEQKDLEQAGLDSTGKAVKKKAIFGVMDKQNPPPGKLAKPISIESLYTNLRSHLGRFRPDPISGEQLNWDPQLLENERMQLVDMFTKAGQPIPQQIAESYFQQEEQQPTQQLSDEDILNEALKR